MDGHFKLKTILIKFVVFNLIEKYTTQRMKYLKVELFVSVKIHEAMLIFNYSKLGVRVSCIVHGKE